MDVRHVNALQSSLARTPGGERVPAGSICDKARSVAPEAEAIERKGERLAARAARKVLETRLSSLKDFPIPEASDFEERLKTAPVAGSDGHARKTYG